MTYPNRAERQQSLITVMTCREAEVVFEVFRSAAEGNRRSLPPGIAAVEDVRAVMRGGMAFFVAYRGRLAGDARPVGAIGYRWERGSLRIMHVAVKEEARGAGVARRLVQAVEAVGFALGSTAVSATVGVENDHHRLFERFGYRASGEGERLPMHKPLV
jgi:GNAT superfamily N-acetyltransferase